MDSTYGGNGIMATFTGPSSAASNGLVMAFDAANPKSYSGSGSTWFDISGNGNDMTLFNQAFNSDGGGNIYFNGSSTYGDLGSNFILSNSAATVSTWAKVINFTSLNAGKTQQARSFIYRSDLSFYSLIAFWNGGYGWENVTNGSPYEVNTTNTAPISAPAIAPNLWFNFVLTFDGNTARSYVNGQFITSVTTTSALQYRYLGRDSNSQNYPDYMYGNIGSFMVYDRALSAEEIETSFHSYRIRYGL
jgi:hypothetical protein